MQILQRMPVPEKIRKYNKLVNERNVMKYMVATLPNHKNEIINVFLHEAEWVLNTGKLIPINKLICHKDGNPMNNQIDNLELVDENEEHGDLHENKIFHEDSYDELFVKTHFPDIYLKVNKDK